jgi:hypothetical protein
MLVFGNFIRLYPVCIYFKTEYFKRLASVIDRRVVGGQPIFQRNMTKQQTTVKQVATRAASRRFVAWFIFQREDGGDMVR